MKKYGKYETKPEGVPAKQPKVKSALLQTYITSLLCMVLCVTMFFGTSYAWFTSEVTNTGNEIYIGKLDVGLFAGDKDLSVSGNKLFDSTNIRWEPGYTALETIKVVDEGDLAFKYALTFMDGSPAAGSTSSIGDIAKWFDVWVYDQQQNNGAPTAGSYADIKAENGWKPIGTLADLLGGKAVLEGKMEEADVVGKDTAHTYTIALHMNGEQVAADQENALNALMGQRISLTVKLVAHQLASEQDGFGDSNYDNAYSVSTAKELQEALDNATGDATIYLANDITGDVTATQKTGINVVIDGNGKTFDGTIRINGQSNGNATETLIIKDIHFVASSKIDASIDAYWGDDNTRYAHNVTVDGCTFTMTGTAKHVTPAVDLYQPYNFTMKNCTVTGAHSVLQNKGGHNGITVDNVTATDCKNGIGLGTMDGAISISKCKMELLGYGIRIDGSETSKGVIISNCEITANIPVVVRKATGTYTITFNGKNTMTQTNSDDLWFAAGIEEYGDFEKDNLGVVTGTIAVKLEGTGLNSAGVYISNQ